MNDRIRISDADREEVAARLREHFAEGRLSCDELDERISAVFAAKTYGDLRHVLTDLPGSEPLTGAVLNSQTGTSAPWVAPRYFSNRRRGPRQDQQMLLALNAALLIPGAGWLF
ncbi:MAG: DUF1707 SHOCT-like domain-containing protein, partial [Streptosporangiaceae bacterium]